MMFLIHGGHPAIGTFLSFAEYIVSASLRFALFQLCLCLISVSPQKFLQRLEFSEVKG